MERLPTSNFMIEIEVRNGKVKGMRIDQNGEFVLCTLYGFADSSYSESRVNMRCDKMGFVATFYRPNRNREFKYRIENTNNVKYEISHHLPIVERRPTGMYFVNIRLW